LKNNNQYIEFTATRNGYIRFSIAVANRNTAMMLKGTEYPSEYEPYGVIIEALDSIMQPFAKGTKILWLGDSIGEAASAGEGTSGTKRFGWSGRVADMFGGTFYSLARSGNTITKNVVAGIGSILTKLEELYTYGQTGKYLIIEGGTNDADRIGSILDPNNLPAKFGSWTKTDYSGNYDEETFCGAVDSLFYKALTHYKGVKIGFMIAQKMGPDVNAVYFANRRAYFDVIKEMCKKWGIPCLDMWDNTWLNPALVNHYDPSKNAQENTDAGSYYTDGQHLTAVAYDYLATVIGEWINTI
jgi:lysophospholipase L1-like esterase